MLLTRRGRSALCLGVLLAAVPLGGCYTYTVYAHDRPLAGSIIEVTLNDRGRVAMEPHMGPEVLSAEGRVLQASDSTFVLAVTRVVHLDRAVQRWGAEQVAFRLEHARQLRERRFSSGRTVLLAGSFTASVVAFVATGVVLNVFGREGSGPSGPGGGVDPDN